MFLETSISKSNNHETLKLCSSLDFTSSDYIYVQSPYSSPYKFALMWSAVNSVCFCLFVFLFKKKKKIIYFYMLLLYEQILT